MVAEQVVEAEVDRLAAIEDDEPSGVPIHTTTIAQRE